MIWCSGKNYEKDIVKLAVQLHAEGVDLEQKDDAAKFLWVHI